MTIMAAMYGAIAIIADAIVITEAITKTPTMRVLAQSIS